MGKLVEYQETREPDNCECIATWGRPSHASPFPL